MELPSLAALRALEAVARHGSVTRAARELHLTQSAISHRLRSLEQELGVPLVARAGRGMRLTAAGAQLARASAEALRVLSDAILALRQSARRRVLSISCSPSFAIRFLVPRLSDFRRAHPELDLRVAADDVPVDPARAGVDASVRLAAGPTAHLVSEKLIDEEVFPVVSPRVLAEGPPLRETADLAQHTLLHDEALADDPRRIGWASWLAAVGERHVDPTRGVRFSHAYLALEAALAGDGVALARRTLVADDLGRGRLVAPLGPAIPSGLAYWLVTAVEASSLPALSALRGFLRQTLRDARAGASSGAGA